MCICLNWKVDTMAYLSSSKAILLIVCKSHHFYLTMCKVTAQNMYYLRYKNKTCFTGFYFIPFLQLWHCYRFPIFKVNPDCRWKAWWWWWWCWWCWCGCNYKTNITAANFFTCRTWKECLINPNELHYGFSWCSLLISG